MAQATNKLSSKHAQKHTRYRVCAMYNAMSTSCAVCLDMALCGVALAQIRHVKAAGSSHRHPAPKAAHCALALAAYCSHCKIMQMLAACFQTYCVSVLV